MGLVRSYCERACIFRMNSLFQGFSQQLLALTQTGVPVWKGCVQVIQGTAHGLYFSRKLIWIYDSVTIHKNSVKKGSTDFFVIVLLRHTPFVKINTFLKNSFYTSVK